MDKLIAAFPSNIEEALQIAAKANFRKPTNEIRNVLICGMGGSGIGGKMVSFWVQDEIPVPIQSFHDYTAPAFIDKHTLVIASSYSGNTEETLISVKQAFKKGAQIIGVCSGGELKSFCIENDFDFVQVPGGNPPRTALAYSVVQVTNILHKVGLISNKSLLSIEKSKDLLLNNIAEIQSEAHKLAEFTLGTVPVFYAGAKYEAVAVRARQQFNENAKVLCWHHVIPEMNHNELVGWGGGDNRFSVVYFNTNDLIPRNQKRVEISLEIIKKKTKVIVLDAKGSDQIERSFYLIHLVDWASLYLSELKKVDPIDIAVIDFLKTELANFK